jgi:hypothetical protein
MTTLNQHSAQRQNPVHFVGWVFWIGYWQCMQGKVQSEYLLNSRFNFWKVGAISVLLMQTHFLVKPMWEVRIEINIGTSIKYGLHLAKSHVTHNSMHFRSNLLYRNLLESERAVENTGKFHPHSWVKYGFHSTDFKETHNSWVAWGGSLLCRIWPKSVKKYGKCV